MSSSMQLSLEGPSVGSPIMVDWIALCVSSAGGGEGRRDDPSGPGAQQRGLWVGVGVPPLLLGDLSCYAPSGGQMFLVVSAAYPPARRVGW